MTSPPGPQYHHNNQSRQNKNTSATLRYLPSLQPQTAYPHGPLIIFASPLRLSMLS
ncbi:hypothetical protein PtA15_3A784 [Puccinia triticina]|uniref:Uncharacterized protein n=1 Tax=Puccinia triticina TaxID=208348 RepID=A0ABY7CDY2_9BASI|nr:uncharacterized protein PtA15_3A784 [Puccinia triticina]WAQ83414.1 hypothetical protein PtA15_3A784 [Puccinia triticina]